MRIHSSSFVGLHLLPILFVGIFSCNKEVKKTPEELLAEKRKEDAAFNNNILEGVGNIFFESTLVPNSQAQLAAKIAYKGDTLAYYTKVNAAGQAQYISGFALSRENDTKLSVIEIDPETSTNRFYNVTNRVKSRFLIEMETLNKTDFEIRILDVDWATGQRKTLGSSLIKSGINVSRYNVETTIDTKPNAANCQEPQPGSSLDEKFKNLVEYLQCGLAKDSYTPPTSTILSYLIDLGNKLKTQDAYKDKASEIDDLNGGFQKTMETQNKIGSSSWNFKFENTRLAGILKWLEAQLKQLKEKQGTEVILLPTNLQSWNYDESSASNMSIGFYLRLKNQTQVGYTERPVFINLKLLVPGTNQIVYSNTAATSPANDGYVSFEINPFDVPNMSSYKKLTAQYSFDGNPSIVGSKEVTLRYIGKVVFENGANLTNPVVFNNTQPKGFRIVDSDGNAFSSINYSFVTIANNTQNLINIQKTTKTNSFDITLTTDVSNALTTQFDILFDTRKIQTIPASIDLTPDSTAYYTARIPGNWTSTTKDLNGNIIRQVKFTLTADSKGFMTYRFENGQTDTRTLPIDRWNVSRGSNKRYYLNVFGDVPTLYLYQAVGLLNPELNSIESYNSGQTFIIWKKE